MSKAIIFDFDGTIADSFSIFVETISEVLNREPLTPDEVKKLRGTPIPKILKYLGVSRWQIPGFVIKGRQGIAKKMNKVEIFVGIDNAIKELSEKGYKIYILSSNSVTSIKTVLEKYYIKDLVINIYGGISITGKSARLKKLLKQEGLSISDVTYVGDEVRDIEATKKVGIKCISVDWGFSTRASLEANKPAVIVSTPQELIHQF